MSDNSNARSTGSDRLASHLQERAGSIAIAPSSVSAVMRRGMIRRQRRRASFAAVGVASVVTTTVVTVHQLSKAPKSGVTFTVNPQGDEAPTNGATSGEAGGAGGTGQNPTRPPAPTITPVASSITWSKVVPDSAEALGSGYFGAPIAPTAPYYRWSTAPGVSASLSDGSRQILYKSSDLVKWTEVNHATQPFDFPAPTASNGSSLFAIATAAVKAPIPKGGAGELVVDVSRDEAATWQHVVLPVDLRALRAQKGVGPLSLQSSIAAGPTGVVATVSVTAYPDLQALGVDISNGYQQTETGITIGGCSATAVATTIAQSVDGGGWIAPSADGSFNVAATAPGIPCEGIPTPKSYTWEALGFSAETAASFSPTVHVFSSPDGQVFAESPPLETPAGQRLNGADVTFSGGKFVMSVTAGDTSGAMSAGMFSSSDGREWTRVMPWGSEGYGYYGYGQLRGGAYAATTNQRLNSTGGTNGSPQDEPVAVVSTDGVTSTTTRLNGLLTPADGKTALINVGASTVGPTGITAVGVITTDPFVEHGPSSLTRDGVTVSIENVDRDVSFTDAADKSALGSLSWRNGTGTANVRMNVNSGGVQLLNADGTVRLEISGGDLGALFNARMKAQSTVVILHSDDGLKWSREDAGSLSGLQSGAFFNGQIEATNTAIFVSILDHSNRSYVPGGSDSLATFPAQEGSGATATMPGQASNAPIPKTIVLVGTPNG